ncbi:MAG: methyltransferase domain-containing protein [Pseudonocardia sp.]|nr:methyltransferase domain-containing protein [Pseudonocardia sp.]
MFATVVPGMSRLVADQLRGTPGIRVTESGFDGRSDVILFEVDRGHRQDVWLLRTIEDLFIEVGRTTRSDGDKPQWIAGRMWHPERVEKALSVWAADVRPLAGTMSFRVIARVLHERSFLRTELRNALSQTISYGKPKWRFADPSQIEVWTSEYRPGSFVTGLRLSTASMRQHDGREVERAGALRPTVAAMMVSLVGPPGAALIDPCCGSGTILGEAIAAGWTDVMGTDIDHDAVIIARRNAPEASVEPGDARALHLSSASVDAVVSNLPFGRQYEIQGDPMTWFTRALAEMARVVRPGGRVVLLAPEIPPASMPASLRIDRQEPIRLLGTKTALWVLSRN